MQVANVNKVGVLEEEEIDIETIQKKIKKEIQKGNYTHDTWEARYYLQLSGTDLKVVLSVQEFAKFARGGEMKDAKIEIL